MNNNIEVTINNEYLSNTYLFKSLLDVILSNQLGGINIPGSLLKEIQRLKIKPRVSINIDYPAGNIHLPEVRLNIIKYYLDNYKSIIDSINITTYDNHSAIDEDSLIDIQKTCGEHKVNLRLVLGIDLKDPAFILKVANQCAVYSSELILSDNTDDFNDFLIFAAELRKSTGCSIGLFINSRNLEDINKAKSFKPSTLILSPENILELYI